MGMTIVSDKMYVLTHQLDVLLEYALPMLTLTRTIPVALNATMAIGLSNAPDGRTLYVSVLSADGCLLLHLDTTTWLVTRRLPIRDSRLPGVDICMVAELEYVQGELWGNIDVCSNCTLTQFGM